MNIKEKMHSGELYYPGDEALMKEQLAYLDKLYDFNMTRPTEQERRKEMLKEMFAEIGKTATSSHLCIQTSVAGMCISAIASMPILT